MKRIYQTLIFIFALTTLLWLLTGDYMAYQLGYFPFRASFIQYSGLIAIVAMSLDMLLAIRPAFVENWLNGLDRVYRAHKYLGIIALSAAVLHFLLAQGTKWAVGWGWLTRPQRPQGAASSIEGLEATLLSWKSTAETIGEWGFYLMVVLCLMALIKIFPYRLFAKMHILFAGVYLAIVLHTLILVDFSYWTQPVGLFIAAFLLIGTISSVIALARFFGLKPKSKATITALDYDPSTALTTITVDVDNKWRGHQAGQFAFMTTSRHEGAHPYTIASHWDSKRPQLTFIIKSLGDYTATLAETLQVGQDVLLEGPYGRFTFNSGKAHQIWIGAGIGVTPFIAKLEDLGAHENHDVQVDFIHTIGEISQQSLQRLQQAAQKAGVKLHVWIDKQNGFFNGDHLRRLVPDWQNADIWFCGPVKFAQILQKDMQHHGLPSTAFHRELFSMR